MATKCGLVPIVLVLVSLCGESYCYYLASLLHVNRPFSHKETLAATYINAVG